MLTLNDGRNELWQWDTGRQLTVDADCSQVHFSNKVFGRSIDVDVVDGIAIIPDILLQTDKDLTAWAFVGTPKNGYTKISKGFKVKRRNKPADYVFTPPEQTTLGQIMERLDDLEAMQDPDAIKNAVNDYLDNNPIQTEETDPTVPAWAKQPTKPSYTAEEVGAQPKGDYALRRDLPGAVVFHISYVDEIYGYSHTVEELFSAYQKGANITCVCDVSSAREYNLKTATDTEIVFENLEVDGEAKRTRISRIVYTEGNFTLETDSVAVPTVPTKVSAFQNDKGYQTEAEVNALINTALGVIENGTY